MSTAAAKIAERNLPEVLTIAFAAGGWDAVKGLVTAFGGKRIRLPKSKVGDHHPLVVAAGRKAADAIVEAFGGDKNFQVPRGGYSLKLMLVKDNLEASANELAEKMGCTYRHAQNLRKEAMQTSLRARRAAGRAKAPKDPRQIDIEELLNVSR